MSTKRRSQAIAEAAAHRVLLSASGLGKDGRVSSAASMRAQDLARTFLKSLAQQVASILTVARRKTVSLEVLKAALEGMERRGVSAEHLHLSSGAKFAQESVVRAFEKNLPKGTRISDESKKALVNLLRAYLNFIARSAGVLAGAAKRKTLLASDVNLALTFCGGL